MNIHPGDKGPAEARHSLDTSTGTLLAILLVGSLFTFIRGVCFNLGPSNGGCVRRGSARHNPPPPGHPLTNDAIPSPTPTKTNTAGERLVARVRQQLFQALIAQDISFFDSAKTGELMNRLAADTTSALECLVYWGRVWSSTYVSKSIHPPTTVIQNACTSNMSMLLRFALQVSAVTNGSPMHIDDFSFMNDTFGGYVLVSW